MILSIIAVLYVITDTTSQSVQGTTVNGKMLSLHAVENHMTITWTGGPGEVVLSGSGDQSKRFI